MIDRINKECGIDFAEKLIERVIDDPVLNHSLHNIAMDMEVNSKILSTEDVEEMESDISSVLPNYQLELLKYNRDHTDNEEAKQALDDMIKKMENEAKIKLIVPERYYISEGNPFPSELSYPEYLMLIVQHLDQFVKMLVSIKKVETVIHPKLQIKIFKMHFKVMVQDLDKVISKVVVECKVFLILCRKWV